MGGLTERLEVRMPSAMLQLLRREAGQRGVSVAYLVREAIELLLEQDREARRLAAEALFQIEAPVADWEEMEREIEDAYREAGRP